MRRPNHRLQRHAVTAGIVISMGLGVASEANAAPPPTSSDGVRAEGPAVEVERTTEPASREGRRRSIFRDDLERGGFHFQVAFGPGGGPDTVGLFHAMELGGTLKKSGVSIALLHTFIQNSGIGPDKNGPDLIGGWMAEVKVPIVFDEIVLKGAAGMGGTHDQSGGKIRANPGPGFAYGLDFHLPVARRSGFTLGLTGMNVWAEGRHHFGAGFGLGYTFF